MTLKELCKLYAIKMTEEEFFQNLYQTKEEQIEDLFKQFFYGHHVTKEMCIKYLNE